MLNHITVMGRIVKDPELRTTPTGTPVCSFTVAVDRDFNPRGTEKVTDFIDCVAWKQAGEFIAKYFHKGSMIIVDGMLQSRKWEDRDGNKRTNWEIVTLRSYFGEQKKSDGYAAGEPEYKESTIYQEEDESDLPF